jgi:hypothetical protein
MHKMTVVSRRLGRYPFRLHSEPVGTIAGFGQRAVLRGNQAFAVIEAATPGRQSAPFHAIA